MFVDEPVSVLMIYCVPEEIGQFQSSINEYSVKVKLPVKYFITASVIHKFLKVPDSESSVSPSAWLTALFQGRSCY